MTKLEMLDLLVKAGGALGGAVDRIGYLEEQITMAQNSARPKLQHLELLGTDRFQAVIDELHKAFYDLKAEIEKEKGL